MENVVFLLAIGLVVYAALRLSVEVLMSVEDMHLTRGATRRREPLLH